jgi:hypothetical protein
MKSTQLILAIAICAFCIPLAAFGQGSLTPPGPPGSTMLALSQIEPRTPISSAPYTISQSGSYYLTTNLTVGATNAITIGANGVTLDLCGFTISSTATPATGYGILLKNALTNIDIENGNISSGVTNDSSGDYNGSGFACGVCIDTNSTSYPVNVRVKNISVTGTSLVGIVIGLASSSVESCHVNVTGLTGINANVVSDSTVQNAGETGITCCIANNCYATCLNGYGFFSYYSVANCIGYCYATANGIQAQYTVQNSYGSSTGGYIGIYAPDIENSYGVNNSSGTGLWGDTVENCYGSTVTGNGIIADTAVGSYGYASGNGTGLEAYGVANACEGFSVSGTGLGAFIASVCHGGTDSGTPFSVQHNVNSY